ncbi:hypothetical protein ANDROMEDA_53 [Bacillus phage Andromeda]|uniref:Uncharacterized protein n=2 Tax=Andromedavirus andromeda TaxID=1273739 RepID=M1HNL9_9CAUD|nr:DNA binding protein [Bacillus phage Andromeda]AGE60892.1 hypothetical protein GEMINI_53 [Bacillus phage Gemini]AGE61123.1 hypothetical protein ANDROMEDA_53 [Bacillus phage Andromeda]
MTNGAGEEKTISVRNNLLEIYDILKASNDIPNETKTILEEKVNKVFHQVNLIHDNLEEVEKAGWKLDVAMDEIGDELYFNGVYTHEV